MLASSLLVTAISISASRMPACSRVRMLLALPWTILASRLSSNSSQRSRLLDDDDLVPLPGETAGHHGADRSATKHDDSHWVRSTYGSDLSNSTEDRGLPSQRNDEINCRNMGRTSETEAPSRADRTKMMK